MLAQAVREHTPLQFKFKFELWTLSLIERQFGKKLALSGVSRIMKLLSFTAQKPLYQAWQQDVIFCTSRACSPCRSARMNRAGVAELNLCMMSMCRVSACVTT
ncbi:hypothetical protein PSAC2689_50397 [Paraburkholderia sacchari]